MSGQFALEGHFKLSQRTHEETRLSAAYWSHSITLLTLDSADAHHSREIKAADNGLSVRELKRQLDSSSIEGIALSHSKHDGLRLASEGQAAGKTTALIKNPLVLEAIGVVKNRGYTESDLETAIIDRLEQFLLELTTASYSRRAKSAPASMTVTSSSTWCSKNVC